MNTNFNIFESNLVKLKVRVTFKKIGLSSYYEKNWFIGMNSNPDQKKTSSKPKPKPKNIWV